jgi:hypothetical protein
MSEQKEASEFMKGIKSIVDKFKGEMPEVTVKGAFISATLESGEAVEIEPALEVGAAVVVVTEGEVIPAPDAVHVLVSGESIVTVDGIITELIPVEEVAEEGEQEMGEPDKETVEQKIKKVVESTIKESHFASQTALDELSVSLTDVFNKVLDERMAKQEEQLHAILMLGFESIEKAPEKEPTKKPKFSATEKKKSWTENFNKTKNK